MLRRVTLVSSLLTLAGCATVVPGGWRVQPSAEPGCEQHRGLVVTDATGQVRDIEDPKTLIPGWNDAASGEGRMQLSRGEGGWWVANKGGARWSESGSLVWIADGSTQFETVATPGRYVGVIVAGAETFAIRSSCQPGGQVKPETFTVIERVPRGASGWGPPVEVQRFDGLCTNHAIADAEGRPLLVARDIHLTWTAPVWNEAVYRVDGPELELLSSIAGDGPNFFGDQIAQTRSGDLILSSGWYRWPRPEAVTAELIEEVLSPAQVLVRVEGDDGNAGYVRQQLVRRCPRRG